MPRINWVEIKKRYLQGEKPKDIAQDYGLTARQISDKAYDEGWGRKRARISEKIEESVEQEVLSLKDQAITVVKAVLKALVNNDGTINKEAFRFVPPGVISTCLNKAMPDGIETQDNTEPKGFVPVEGYRPELI